jgi:integrase
LAELQERIDTYKGRAQTRLTVLLSLHVFVRSSELRFARWSEFDLKGSLRRSIICSARSFGVAGSVIPLFQADGCM